MIVPVLFGLLLVLVGYATLNSVAICRQRIRVAWMQVDAQATHLRETIIKAEPHVESKLPKVATIADIIDLEKIGRQCLSKHNQDEFSSDIDMALNRLHFAQSYYNDIAKFFNRRFQKLPWVVFKTTKTCRPRPLFSEIHQSKNETEAKSSYF